MPSASAKLSQDPVFIDPLEQPLVIVVDDDASMRSALRRLFNAEHIAAEYYASGTEFLAQARMDRPGCILLDVGMPGVNGLDVQAILKQRRIDIPVIFLTGTAQVPIAVAAMREGAVDFIEKPFDNDDLIARIKNVIQHHRRKGTGEIQPREVRRRQQLLTARERSVVDLVVLGSTSKEIARSLGGSHRTIEIHRRNAMKKMCAATLADLVRMHIAESG
jgi:two-component system, LuxR family, response regulator FixJ